MSNRPDEQRARRTGRLGTLGLACALALVGAAAPAVDVMVIPDRTGPGLDALVGGLSQRGLNVVVSAATEDAYDGTSPSPLGFAAVIHLDGATRDLDMPMSGQLSLVNYVRGGGAFIHAAWDAYEIAQGRLQAMRDLVLFDDGVSTNTSQLTLSVAPGEEGSPLLAGLPGTFSFFAAWDSGVVHAFRDQPAEVVMHDDLGGDAVATRAFGMGRVVAFHFAVDGGDALTLGNAAVLQLYTNAVCWTTGVGIDFPPTLTLNPPASATIAYGSSWVEPGATAFDPEDGDISASIRVSGVVDTSLIGPQTVFYSVSDHAGHLATAQRTITVADVMVPVLMLNGSASVALRLGQAYQEAGWTASDDVDGDITAKVVRTGAVNSARAGDYTLTYVAADSSGNTAVVTRVVSVYAPPKVACSTAVTQLSWSGGNLSDVGLRWSADSRRAIVSVTCRVTQDEALSDKSHDAELSFANALPDHLWLRNARIASADGRVYLVMITAIDDLGQTSTASCTVVVPKGGSQKQLDDVRGQASADLAAGKALPVDSFGMPSGNG